MPRRAHCCGFPHTSVSRVHFCFILFFKHSSLFAPSSFCRASFSLTLRSDKPLTIVACLVQFFKIERTWNDVYLVAMSRRLPIMCHLLNVEGSGVGGAVMLTVAVLFATAAVTNGYTSSGPQQHKGILLQFWRLVSPS